MYEYSNKSDSPTHVVHQYEIGGVRYIVNATIKDGAKENSVKKIRATWQFKGRFGERLTTIPPMGTRKTLRTRSGGLWMKKLPLLSRRFVHCVWTVCSRCKLQNGSKKINFLHVAYCFENDLLATSKQPTVPYKLATKMVGQILECLDYFCHTVN